MSKSKYVVSANYRDRYSEYRWLVRREDQPIEDAVPCKMVCAMGISIGPSGKHERGFGCAVVAICEDVAIVDAESPSEIPTEPLTGEVFLGSPDTLEFDGTWIQSQGRYVHRLGGMVLSPDGSMLGYSKQRNS